MPNHEPADYVHPVLRVTELLHSVLADVAVRWQAGRQVAQLSTQSWYPACLWLCRALWGVALIQGWGHAVGAC